MFYNMFSIKFGIIFIDFYKVIFIFSVNWAIAIICLIVYFFIFDFTNFPGALWANLATISGDLVTWSKAKTCLQQIGTFLRVLNIWFFQVIWFHKMWKFKEQFSVQLKKKLILQNLISRFLENRENILIEKYFGK